MNVTCPSCETVYRVDPSKVPAGGVRARCAVCSNVFPVNAASGAAQRAPVAEPGPPPAPPRAAPPPAPRAVPAPAPPPQAPAVRPAAPPPAPAPRAAPAPGLRPPAAPAAPPAPPPPAAPSGAAPGPRMTSALRPVNPFMGQDPKQKARRLARALVSDLVVYHPEKRQQGLRDGTLPQLFKDEIEKSWQEYVEQVGAELAKTTSFWAEALNEILAGGNKVF